MMGPRTLWIRALATLATVSLCASVWAQEVKLSDQAREHFKAGVAYLNDPDGARYEDAYREFKEVLAEAKTPKTIYNAGLCAFHLERDQEAIQLWSEFLATAGKDFDAIRPQVERDLAVLKAGLVSIQVTVTPPGAALLDERIPANGKPVLNRYQSAEGSFSLGIHPGRHRIRAEMPGSGLVSDVWEFDGVAGAALQHDFRVKQPKPLGEAPGAQAPQAPMQAAAPAPLASTLPPPAATERHTSAGVYVGLAATGAFAVGATVVGILALDKHAEFDRENRDSQNQGTAANLRTTGKQLNLVTDVLIGAAVLAAGGTTYLYFSQKKAHEKAPSASVRVRPTVGRDGGSLTVTGRF